VKKLNKIAEPDKPDPTLQPVEISVDEAENQRKHKRKDRENENHDRGGQEKYELAAVPSRSNIAAVSTRVSGGRSLQFTYLASAHFVLTCESADISFKKSR